MTDARRLVHAVTCNQLQDTLAFVLELDQALEHVNQLELGAVQVRPAAEPGTRHRADDMGHHLAAGGLRDAQVAVLENGRRPRSTAASTAWLTANRWFVMLTLRPVAVKLAMRRLLLPMVNTCDPAES